MSYTPTEWKTGDVITAEKLNKIENGIAGAGEVLVMNIIQQSPTLSHLDKTCLEIKSALTAGKPLLCTINSTDANGTMYGNIDVLYCELLNGGGCIVTVKLGSENATYEAPSDNDYPTFEGGK